MKSNLPAYDKSENYSFKVTLINPAYDKILKTKGMSFHYHKILQPISLAYIASLCRSNGMKVEIIDANVDQISSSDELWETLNSDVFVVTTASLDNWQCPFFNIDEVKNIIQRLKTRNPVLTVGPIISEKPSYVLKEFGDNVIGIRGEPEFTTIKVIKNIRNKKNWKIIDGISFIDPETGIIQNNNPAEVFNIDALPKPAYDLLKMDKYTYEIFGDKLCLMEFSRGCPYKCNFCLKTMYRDIYKTRDPKKIVDEIEYLKEKFKVKNIYFIDLEFTISKWNTIALCKEIVNRNIEINFAIQTRVDGVDDELLHWLKKSGCKLIHFGVESGDQEILKSTNKMITIEKIEDAFFRTKKMKIKTLGYFTIGHPTEKREHILKTIEFAKRLNPDYASFVLVIPYPGTALYDENNSEILYLKVNENLELDELEKLRKKALLEFYLRPEYIVGKLFSIRSLKDIKMLWMGFTKLFIPLTTDFNIFKIGKKFEKFV